jgi:hypothetical protein
MLLAQRRMLLVPLRTPWAVKRTKLIPLWT